MKTLCPLFGQHFFFFLHFSVIYNMNKLTNQQCPPPFEGLPLQLPGPDGWPLELKRILRLSSLSRLNSGQLPSSSLAASSIGALDITSTTNSNDMMHFLRELSDKLISQKFIVRKKCLLLLHLWDLLGEKYGWSKRFIYTRKLLLTLFFLKKKIVESNGLNLNS